MDREYLEDYEQKERVECKRLERRIREGKFTFKRDRFPPDNRFVRLQRPVAIASPSFRQAYNVWAQIPFSGSLILEIAPLSKSDFQRVYFNVTEIPEIIDFIKKTGRLQVVLPTKPVVYEGLDYLDPFFKELNPPLYSSLPPFVLGNDKEIQKATDTFYTLARVRYLDFIRRLTQKYRSYNYSVVLVKSLATYLHLKMTYTSMIVEEIENLMIDDVQKAFHLIGICKDFIVDPMNDMLSSQRNYTLERFQESQILPVIYQPLEIRLPCEIGKFLLKKLTYAAQDMRACYDLIDHYDSYDLQKVQQSLNEAIAADHPDIVNKSTEELSEILDNVWNDPEIPKLVKNLKRGIPMSIAAIGSAVSAFTGSFEGFFAGLGFSVGAKFLDLEIEGLSERLAKWLTRSYQANVYDFKKKYKHRIMPI